MVKKQATADNLDNIVDTLLDEEVLRFQLTNGLTVIAKENHSAEIVSTQLWVKTGSIHEDRFLGSGISHYVEHMLFKGTDKRDYKKISNDIHAKGANTNAYTTFDRTVYYIDGPNDALEMSLDVLSDIVFHSNIDPLEAANEKSVILREIDMGLDEPSTLLSEGTFKTVYHNHPYKYPVIGIRSIFEGLSRDDLWEYYQKRYSPNNCVLVVVGTFDTPTLLEQIEKYFGSLPMRSLNAPYIATEPLQYAQRSFYQSGDYNLTRGNVVFKTPGLGHDDTPGLRILANAMGEGISSLLWQELREKENIVHSIDTSVWTPVDSGLFWISYSCDPEKRAVAEEGIYRICDQVMQKGFQQSAIDKAIRQAMIGEINTRKTMSGQASQLGSAEVVAGDLGFPRYMLNKLKAVQAGDLQDLAKKYLVLEQSTKAALEPNSVKKASVVVKKPLALPDFEEITLKNGVRVLLQPYFALPKVQLSVVSLGGPLYESVDQRGLTALMSTLLTKDTQKRSALEVAEATENLGINFSEMAGNNTFGFGMEFLPSDLDVSLEILEQALLEPTFLKDTFEIERDGQISSIQMTLDEITSYATLRLRELFFGEYPFRVTSLGTVDALEGMTRDDAAMFYKKLVCADNLAVAVTGSFERDVVLEKLAWLEKIPSTPFQKQTLAFAGPEQGSFEETAESEQAIVLVAYPDVTVTDADFQTGEVLDEITSGMSSKLYSRVREELGLAYFVGSQRVIGTMASMFFFFAGTHPKHAEQVVQEIEAEVARLKRGDISDAEIADSKTHILAQRKMNLQRLGARTLDASLNCLYGLPVNQWRTYDKLVEAVSKDSIQAFAQKYFDDAQKVKLVIGGKTLE
ncbi:MAG: hypothetical protein AUJ82_04915 [Verrucomicrobia bacterium CG1_02_43_26]|nr:MAG: hypothetical protein AUJ82_04915 [Verrucomicrobia bacterium CG1_02_43_26]